MNIVSSSFPIHSKCLIGVHAVADRLLVLVVVVSQDLEVFRPRWFSPFPAGVSCPSLVCHLPSCFRHLSFIAKFKMKDNIKSINIDRPNSLPKDNLY